jgi:hypothetical protein
VPSKHQSKVNPCNGVLCPPCVSLAVTGDSPASDDEIGDEGIGLTGATGSVLACSELKRINNDAPPSFLPFVDARHRSQSAVLRSKQGRRRTNSQAI